MKHETENNGVKNSAPVASGILAAAPNPTHGVPPLGGSAPKPIPQHILDHAERCYPTERRPKCSIWGRNFDREKQECIQGRLRIEAEDAIKKAKAEADATPAHPVSSHASQASHNSHNSHNSHSHAALSAPSIQSFPSPTPKPNTPPYSVPTHSKPGPTSPTPARRPKRNHLQWNRDQQEEQEPLTPEQVREAFCVLMGPEFVSDTDPDPDDQRPAVEQPEPEINFPELENPCPTLSLQQTKPEENPRKPESSRVRIGFPQSKTTRSPHEPKRGPRGLLNELPEPTQQKILDLLQNHTREEVAAILAKPVPHGIGQSVSDSTLERFEKRHRIIQKRSDADAIAETARQSANDPYASDADLTNTTLHILRAAVLEYSTDIQNFESLERLNTVLYRIRRADQADRRQTYLEQIKP